MKKLTCIITALNEGVEPLETIKSIRGTSPIDEVDIILFNDGTQPEEWVNIPDELEVKVIDYNIRKGAPFCYDMGVELAKTPYVAIFNSRMRFTKGWFEKVIPYLESNPKTLFCTTSIVLREGQTDITKSKEKRYGAEINGLTETGEILQPSWLKQKKGKCYDVPCVLGANYFVTRKWYKYIRGFSYLEFYGGMCAYISLKSWAFGGDCKLIKEIEIGNVYREKKPYNDVIDSILFNKLFTLYVLSDHDSFLKAMFSIQKSDYKQYYTLLLMRFIRDKEKLDHIRKTFSKLQILNINHLIK